MGQPVADALVAVQDRHREQDRPGLPGADERGRGLRRRRQQHRDTIVALLAVGHELGPAAIIIAQHTWAQAY
jgi:hypothetical protein